MRSLDSTGRYIDSTGRSIDRTGRSIDSTGRSIDGVSCSLDDQALANIFQSLCTRPRLLVADLEERLGPFD